MRGQADCLLYECSMQRHSWRSRLHSVKEGKRVFRFGYSSSFLALITIQVIQEGFRLNLAF